MDGIACALNKKCRKQKSEEIVNNMNAEQSEYENIYKNKTEDKEK